MCIRVAHSAEFNYVVLGKRIDDALIAIEQDDPRLKGIFDQQFALIHEKLAKLGYSLEMQ